MNYEMAYVGACVQLDALAAKYIELEKAATLVLDTLDNKYTHGDALDALWALLNRDEIKARELRQMG